MAKADLYMSDIKKEISELSFDKASKELKEVVSALESEDCSLEELIKLHSRGQHLLQRCQSLLDSAEVQIAKFEEDSKEEGLCFNLLIRFIFI